MSRIRKVLTFSNVIAVIALFVALGGSVYAAGKINGKQIKPKSLPGNRIEPKTLTGRQVKARSLTGKQIKQSTLGGVSAAALTKVKYGIATIPLTNWNPGTVATAACPAGMHVVGGGATVSNSQRAQVMDSGPTSPRTGWTATGSASSSATEAQPTMTVTAICVVVKGKVGSGPSTNNPTPTPNYRSAR